MIDQQQQIDHDEHAAVTAEAEAEAAAELAHEQLVATLAAELYALSADRAAQARKSLAAAIEGVEHRLMPTHHYLWAEQAQVAAHVAARCAVTVESYRGYRPGEQIEALLAALIRQAGGGREGAHVANAATRVRRVLAQVTAR